MAKLLLFAQAKQIAGLKSVDIDGVDVAAVVSAARERFGPDFAALLPHCRVWLNGEPADGSEQVAERDEVAILPPVSGG